jgi:hypothetical protein
LTLLLLFLNCISSLIWPILFSHLADKLTGHWTAKHCTYAFWISHIHWENDSTRVGGGCHFLERILYIASTIEPVESIYVPSLAICTSLTLCSRFTHCNYCFEITHNIPPQRAGYHLVHKKPWPTPWGSPLCYVTPFALKPTSDDDFFPNTYYVYDTTHRVAKRESPREKTRNGEFLWRLGGEVPSESPWLVLHLHQHHHYRYHDEEGVVHLWTVGL